MKPKLTRLPNLRTKRVDSLFLFIPITFYAIALFPGRIYRDSTVLLEQMRTGESSDQWTALYFRYLQVTTINGRYLFISSILGLVILTLSFYWFMRTLELKTKIFNFVTLTMVASPFIGVFGMTVGHDTTTASGVLLLFGTLLKVKKSQDNQMSYPVMFLGIILCSTSFLGFTAVLGFAIALLFIKKTKLSVAIAGIAFVQIFFGTIILNVNSANDDLRLTSFLGDIKCIAQHPDAKISSEQWASINKLAPEALWKSQTSCWIADNAYFALGEASKDPRATAILWAKLATQNPQISIMAHIQRASVALPPVFFSPPPNMIETNYSEPIGKGTADDLQKFSELFKTSIDDLPSRNYKLLWQSPFEYAALFITFVFNQHSSFWGWAGLWLVMIIIIGKLHTELRMKDTLFSALPLVAMHLAMVLVSPAPNPRYLMATTIIGISFVLTAVINKFETKN